MAKRDEVLTTAKSLISGERAAAYGDARENFTKVGKMWEQVLGVPVTPEQVTLCMALLKVSRAAVQPDRLDNWIDIAGYSALGAEIGHGSSLASQVLEDLDTVEVDTPDPVLATHTSSIAITIPAGESENDDDVVDDTPHGSSRRRR